MSERPLMFDVARCDGRINDDRMCTDREACARYLSLTKWDAGKVPKYRGISVMPAVDGCENKIEVSQ